LRKLDRYVFREMWIPFIAGTLVVALLFQANSYIFLAKNYNVENIPVLARIQWLLYTLPSQLKLTLPTGMALAAALSIGRMGRESEITALRSAGGSVARLMRPVILFGLVAGALNFFMVDRIIPVYNKRAAELFSKNAILGLSNTNKFKANAFIQLDKYAASMGSIVRRKDDVLDISDVMLIERSGSGVKTIFTSPRGTYDAGLWSFPEGTAYMLEHGELTTMEAKKSLSIDQTVDLNALFASASVGLQSDYSDIPTKELKLSIATALKSKIDSRPFEVELHSRYAAGFACAVFAFTSAVFAVAFSRSGGFAGLLVSFSVVVLYYNAYVISVEILGKQENVPTWLAAWLPNIAFGILGLAWLRRIE
jgi:lipopolysaccharide export system permease protein